MKFVDRSPSKDYSPPGQFTQEGEFVGYPNNLPRCRRLRFGVGLCSPLMLHSRSQSVGDRDPLV
ncbi:MAG: hypothetical protein HC769_30550 [Cyanobacteria bacterium CRU_2_1]|nr:hypothetical protein [Cyanobacteria bacterium RU_5_0]NJR62750.1 hypothetical protein [Cyanobacteria bacterium CRU_2_1]